jgi:hypothetical protein
MVVHHQPAGVPRETAATDQHVARHAGAAHHEPGQARRAPGLVHSGRAAEFTCVATVAHGDYREQEGQKPVVLGFQGRSQLEELYGRKAEAMLSQPATKVFLRTDEANSSKWISQTIGEVEIERLRESRMEGHFPRNRRDSRNYQLERTTEPLVMASEIQGLPDLRAYLKSGNLVVPLSFPYIELPQKQPRLHCARKYDAHLIEIGKRPSQESTPREPQRSKGIAAGQEPYLSENHE